MTWGSTINEGWVRSVRAGANGFCVAGSPPQPVDHVSIGSRKEMVDLARMVAS